MSSDSQMVEKKKNKRQPKLWDTSQIYIFLYFKFNCLTEGNWYIYTHKTKSFGHVLTRLCCSEKSQTDNWSWLWWTGSAANQLWSSRSARVIREDANSIRLLSFLWNQRCWGNWERWCGSWAWSLRKKTRTTKAVKMRLVREQQRLSPTFQPGKKCLTHLWKCVWCPPAFLTGPNHHSGSFISLPD